MIEKILLCIVIIGIVIILENIVIMILVIKSGKNSKSSIGMNSQDYVSSRISHTADEKVHTAAKYGYKICRKCYSVVSIQNGKCVYCGQPLDKK